MTEPAPLSRPQLRRMLRKARRALSPSEQRKAALGLYGNWAHDNFFVDTSLMYGWNDNESKRYIAGTRAKANYDSEIFGVNALAGYTFQLDKQWLLEPQVGARRWW